MKPLINHSVANGVALHPYNAQAYEYITGQNGVFVRSERESLKVMIPVAPALSSIRGLSRLETSVEIPQKVPAEILERVLAESIQAANSKPEPLEKLFHILFLDGGWKLIIPEQIQSHCEVRPTDTGPDSSYAKAIIEIHSHHFFQARFSQQDDIDEMGFRVYCVIGSLGESRPELSVRVGVHGHRWEIPADLVFDIPETITNLQEVFDGY